MLWLSAALPVVLFFNPSWLRCGAALLLVLRGARCAFELRGLTARYNDDTEKKEEDVRILQKTFPAVRCLHVSRRSGGGQDSGCQFSSQGCFVRFAKDQRKLFIAQRGQFVIFCVARPWIFEETGPSQQRLEENANRNAPGVQRIGRGKMVRRMRNSCKVEMCGCQPANFVFMIRWLLQSRHVRAESKRRWSPALARKYG